MDQGRRLLTTAAAVAAAAAPEAAGMGALIGSDVYCAEMRSLEVRFQGAKR